MRLPRLKDLLGSHVELFARLYADLDEGMAVVRCERGTIALIWDDEVVEIESRVKYRPQRLAGKGEVSGIPCVRRVKTQIPILKRSG